ncbi:MAG: SpoIIE family protein phosphatase [Synechococcaceae cyanobacterium SM2_3_60]|nr:SpoIIE family protein phosphatase [Synechococcaceae cyanobacterium SM2_3_60]
MRYGSAGHPPAFLLSPATSLRCLSTRGLPIGMLPDSTYQQASCIVAPQSTLYLYSDGAYELRLPEVATGQPLGSVIDRYAASRPHA